MLGPTAQTGILPFDDSGGDGSPPLLLIHALGADRRMWGDVISQLDPPRRCVAVDLFGAGAAPLFPAEAPTLADHVDALQRLVEELGLERVVPAGCAVGSMMACALARRLGSRAPALVLANPILRITRDAGEVLLDRGRRIRARGIGAIEDEVLGNAFSGVPDAGRRAGFRGQFLKQSAQGYAALAAGLVGADVSEDTAALACPTLLVPGEGDIVLPGWHCDEIGRLIADVRCRPVEAGHFAPQQAPRQFAAEMSAFLGEALEERPAAREDRR